MSVVYISHNVDTEGPLSEGYPVHRKENLKFPHIDVDFASDNLDNIISKHRGMLLGSWQDISAMLDVATSKTFRHRTIDSFGGGWIFNWFCMDHVGYIDNPRHRAMGI